MQVLKIRFFIAVVSSITRIAVFSVAINILYQHGTRCHTLLIIIVTTLETVSAKHTIMQKTKEGRILN